MNQKDSKNKLTKICIFGGTFNPPHIGHKMIVDELLKLDFDEIIIMPCYQSEHKKSNIAIEHRIAMARIFCDIFANQKISLSLYEIEKSSTTYTYETIEHFADKNVDLYFALGTDTLIDLDSWEHSDFIKQNVTFVLADRSYSNTSSNCKVICLNNDLISVSSSEIRSGKCIEYLDKPIYDYIVKYDLYGFGSLIN